MRERLLTGPSSGPCSGRAPILDPKPCCSHSSAADQYVPQEDRDAVYTTDKSTNHRTRRTAEANQYQLASNEYSDPIESSQADSAPDRLPSRQPSHRTRRRRRRQDEPQPPNDAPPITQHRHFCSSRIFKVALLVHVISLLACASASLSTSSHGSGKGPPLSSLAGGGASSYEYSDENYDEHSQSAAVPNRTPQKPCVAFHPLRNSYQNEEIIGIYSQVHNQSLLPPSQCLVWTSSSPHQLCTVNEEKRFQLLKATYLFPELQPISLYEIFTAGAGPGESLASRLKLGVEGIDCIRDDADKCESCYIELDKTIRKLDEAYRSFNATLHRFDCLPAVDTSSATRPFSPNGTCDNCKVWYRRWLLVQKIGLWRYPPCINWCYYAQLACPHLAPYKIWDFAGHPSFQCRDFDIYATDDTDAWCSCIHPCDLKGIVPTNQPIVPTPSGHDFYAARQHCEARRRQCRSTAHDRHRARQKSKATSPRHVSFGLLFLLPMILVCSFVN
ncbi:hypothetical protein WR25_14080 [Diploscapter pachys]|uniref:Transmembrane protein n=1 Tax=Diploscapter pachys TaxID=2018661 RepID=A0A2A2KTB4_9BILA|nr:hypothetical protein WR25_14080 [Diploscapter pachys]